MKRLLIPGGLLAFFVIQLAFSHPAPAEKKSSGLDVLVVHATGTPSTNLGKFTPQNIDAVSCPTPVAMNCEKVAVRLAKALNAKQLRVSVVAAGEVKHRDQILGPRLVVLGSPSYFATVSWKMHKLFDEKFFEIHALGGKRLGDKTFATFVMGKSDPKCRKSIEAMATIVRACQGTPGPSMVVLTSHTSEQVDEAIGQFAEQIAGQLKSAQ